MSANVFLAVPTVNLLGSVRFNGVIKQSFMTHNMTHANNYIVRQLKTFDQSTYKVHLACICQVSIRRAIMGNM